MILQLMAILYVGDYGTHIFTESDLASDQCSSCCTSPSWSCSRMNSFSRSWESRSRHTKSVLRWDIVERSSSHSSLNAYVCAQVEDFYQTQVHSLVIVTTLWLRPKATIWRLDIFPTWLAKCSLRESNKQDTRSQNPLNSTTPRVNFLYSKRLNSL